MALAPILFMNNAGTTLAGAITSTATTANLQAGAGASFPNPGAGQYFCMTFTDAATGLIREIVHVTAVVGDVVTIVRGQEGTAAKAWSASDLAENLWTAGSAAELFSLVEGPYVNSGGFSGVGTNAISLGWSTATSGPLVGQLVGFIDATNIGGIARLGGGVGSTFYGAVTVNANLIVNGTATVTTLGVTGNAGVNGNLSIVGQINTSNQVLTNLGIISSGSINCGITAGNTNPVGSAQPGLVISPQGTLNSYSSGWVIGTATANLIGLFSGANPVGGITTNGSSVAFNTTSDYRLKVNVVPLASATARINSVPVHRFNFVDQITESNLDPTPVDGFLAHEIAQAVPEAVTGTKDATATYADAVISGTTGAVLASGVTQADWTAGKALEPPTYPVDSTWQATITVPVYQQVDQSKLTPVLWAAVQELSAQITALQAQVSALVAAQPQTPAS